MFWLAYLVAMSFFGILAFATWDGVSGIFITKMCLFSLDKPHSEWSILRSLWKKALKKVYTRVAVVTNIISAMHMAFGSFRRF